MHRLINLAAVMALAALGVLLSMRPASAAPALQWTDCGPIKSAAEIPSPGLIHFDDLANAAVIGDTYVAAFGVRFEDTRSNRAVIYGNEPTEAHSRPNVAINNAVSPNTSAGVPMQIAFASKKTHVGLYIGNGQMVEAGDPVQVSAVRTTNLDQTFEGFYRPR